MKQQNKIIVVGATSGLGRMLAERYIHDGHVVGIVGRRGDKLAEVAKGHPEVHCLKADVTDIGRIATHLAALAGEMGGLDLFRSGTDESGFGLRIGVTHSRYQRAWMDGSGGLGFLVFYATRTWTLGRHFVGSRHPWLGSGSCLFRFQGLPDPLFGSVAPTCTHFPQEGLRDGCSSRIRSYSLAFPSRKIVLGG